MEETKALGEDYCLVTGFYALLYSQGMNAVTREDLHSYSITA